MSASGTRNTLAYGEQREIEKILRKVWKGKGYIEGENDGTVSVAAATAIRKPVTAANVMHIRKELGLAIRGGNRLQAGTLLTIEDLRKLEDHLTQHRKVVVTLSGKGHVHIQSLEMYRQVLERVHRVKMWEKSPNHNRVANGGLTESTK